MSDSTKKQTQVLKAYLEEDKTPYNPEQSLHKALKAAKVQNASRDIFSLFISWVWVIFAGFGASAHKELSTRKHSNKRKHIQRKNTHRKSTTNAKK